MKAYGNKIKLQPIGKNSGLKIKKSINLKNKLLFAGGILGVIILLSFVGCVFWYKVQLEPVGSDTSQLKKITIASGSSPSQIGELLQEQSVIKSSFAFTVYVRLSGKNSSLQAGTYRLSPAETTQQIVSHLVNGSVDRFNITFYPGGALADAVKIFKKAGYSDAEISSALNKSYVSPLFAGKPKGSDLEGYIYGETYNFNVGVTVDDMLTTIFSEFYKKISENNIPDGFKKHGLNLFQGITLASIVQKEVNGTNDQKQAAQVFYSRLSIGMQLGSDVTYQYIADKTNVPRDPNLDSPYNTRKYTGLPPGPISNPGLSALKAVAEPASGDYLYFLSGDDNITYFAKTLEGHEANIANHCKVKCSTL